MVNRKAARRYTKALYSTALQAKKLEVVERDLSDIKKSVINSRELFLFLNSPIIESGRKLEIFKNIFKNKIDDLTLKFLEIIFGNKRENILIDIADDFVDLLNIERKIIPAEIKTFFELKDKEKDIITDKLKTYTGKEIKATFKVDKNIKGGFVAKIKDTIIDASIKRQLELLHEQFKKGSFSLN